MTNGTDTMTKFTRGTVVSERRIVTLMVRSVSRRAHAFAGCSYMAWLERPNGTSLGITRGHESWSAAATAALALAKRRNLNVSNEAAVSGRIAADGAVRP